MHFDELIRSASLNKGTGRATHDIELRLEVEMSGDETVCNACLATLAITNALPCRRLHDTYNRSPPYQETLCSLS